MLKTLTARKQLPLDNSALTIRFATPDDEATLVRLAQLDSSRTPQGDVLVAEVDGEMWAALSLADAHAVSDPWRPAAEAVWMLSERSRQLHRQRPGRRHRLQRVRAAAA